VLRSRLKYTTHSSDVGEDPFSGWNFLCKTENAKVALQIAEFVKGVPEDQFGLDQV